MLDSIRLRLSTDIQTLGVIEPNTDIEQTKDFIKGFREHSIEIYNKLQSEYSFYVSYFIFKEVSDDYMAIETSLHEFSINLSDGEPMSIEVFDKKIGDVVRHYMFDQVIEHVEMGSLSKWMEARTSLEKFKALSTILLEVITKKLLK